MNIRHQLLHPAVLAAFLSLALTSCGKDDSVATTDNALLTYVPEDTPYLAGNLEPIPEDVIDAFFRRAQPVLDAMQEAMAGTSVKLSGSAARENPEVAIVGALLDELDGKLNRQGIESMGFTMKANQAVYGLGAFPVIRLSLGSAQALRDTIGRIEASSGIDFPELEYQGQSYWRLAGGRAQADDDAPAGLYIAIIERVGGAHLALGLFPPSAEAELLPAFLGQDRPASNTAAMRLAGINRTYGYAPYGTAVVDFQRLFEQFVNPASVLNRTLKARGVDPAARLGEACQREIGELIARAPRMVAGTTELTTTAMAGQYRLELANDLASELADLVADVPPAPATSQRVMEFALGIRIGAARDFLIRKATELSQETFECEALKGIRQQASEALVKLEYPLPPLVNNFLGVRASISELPENESDLGGFKGTAALHVDKPEMFLGMAKMFLPQLEDFQLTSGGPPVLLPESLMPMPGITAYAAMSDSALGIALGQGEESRLPDYLDAKSTGDGSFFSINYDMAAYMNRIDAFADDWKGAGVSDDIIMGGEFEHAVDDSEQAQVIVEAIEEAVKGMAGRSQMSLRFDEHGFAIDSRLEFKQ